MDRTQQTDLVRTFRWLSGVVMAVSLQGFRFELKVRGEHFGTVCHSGERHTAIEKSMPIWEQIGVEFESAP